MRKRYVQVTVRYFSEPADNRPAASGISSIQFPVSHSDTAEELALETNRHLEEMFLAAETESLNVVALQETYDGRQVTTEVSTTPVA